MTRSRNSKRTAKRRAISIVEVLLACILFVLVFLPIMRVFSETGMSQQKMIRDFPVAFNIAERIMNTVENEIAEGRFQESVYVTADPEGIDVTNMILENASILEALKLFLGTETEASTKFIGACQVKLLVKPTSDPDIIEMRLKFRWADRVETGQTGFRHCIELNMLKNRI